MKDYQNSKRLARGMAAALAAMLALGAALPCRAAKLSPALDIIAADFTMAKSGLVGTDIYFDAEDFSESLGVEQVSKITIASLPDMTVGHLQLGSKYVEVGDTISGRNLDSLKFVPYGTSEAQAVFSFCCGSDPFGTAYECTVYTTKNVNTAPVIGVSESIPASGEVSVYSGVKHLGSIPYTDAEGDPVTFEILDIPANGTVRLTDASRGYYEYTAGDGYTGKDSFTVRAVDKYGNRSAAVKITLRAEEPQAHEVYADMDGHWANEAVISCVRSGVIDAASTGDFFYPDELVSRAEFLSLAMKAAGYSGFYAASTGFDDDALIPAEHKGYIAAAEALGIISGIRSGPELLFCPNNQITRSEAAVIISRLTGITGDGAVAVFADSDSIPAWAAAAMTGLHDAGILRGSGTNTLDAYASITRGAAAKLAASIAALR